MASEIERKFLVNRELWPAPPGGVTYRQGYLSVDPERTVRVRTVGPDAFITVKGLTRGVERLEFEYAIPAHDAQIMLDRLCLKPMIEKTRFRIEFAGHVWEVDEFMGDNAGLLLAEIELPASDTHFDMPPLAGAEVSGDPRYFNSNLVREPYKTWSDGERR
ncbi:MAG TPA: CYTH domain-containing protein [Gemmatimonadaceae bacterium]|nr:CYTH domain-containing protein [Gemmatimonadaceae bacterium]